MRSLCGLFLVFAVARPCVAADAPTPRPLERARIYISPDDGQVVVDKAQKYQWELGQWEDPSSYIPLA